MAKSQKYGFEAETGKVLELLTHSIYSKKEIFLRELISNASDAIDKAKIKSLTQSDYLGDNNDLKIWIDIDKDNKTLTIKDNGIGMTQEEIHKNLGTIAKSGTGEFLEKLKKAKQGSENNLIGQFGVGFYSSFMVADSVTVKTKSAESDSGYEWKSDGKSDYTLKEIDKKDRGTEVILHFDNSDNEFLEEWKIRELIKKYSQYTSVPIMMIETDTRNEEEKKKEPNKKFDYEQVNNTKPLWKQNKSSIKEEDYNGLYTEVSMDYQKPLGHVHTNAEGVVSYKSILFFPEKVNMFMDMQSPETDYGPRLYIQNVLILEHAKEMLPVWLRFVSGVVETSDLPLNISREMLQSNTTLEKIKSGLTKKVLSELKKIKTNSLEAKDGKYREFNENFGRILKEGIYYDGALSDQIAEIILFDTLLNDEQIDLDTYIENIKEDDKKIYYILAKDKNQALMSPYLENYRKEGKDVLLLTDPVDNWLVTSMKKYKDVDLVDINQIDQNTEDTDKKDDKEKNEDKKKQDKEYKDFLEFSKNLIGSEKVEKVQLSDKIGDSIAAVKTPQNGLNPQMQKMMKAMGQDIPTQKYILEVNPNHPLIEDIKQEFEKDKKSEKINDILKYAYNQAILRAGGDIENMSEFLETVEKFAKNSK